MAADRHRGAGPGKNPLDGCEMDGMFMSHHRLELLKKALWKDLRAADHGWHAPRAGKVRTNTRQGSYHRVIWYGRYKQYIVKTRLELGFT